MALSISFLRSSEAAEQRMISRKPAWVVHAEVESGLFVELDADDADHAHRLAANWCERGAAISASARRALHNGTLCRPSGRIHSDLDHIEWAAE